LLEKMAIIFHTDSSDHEKVDWIVTREISLSNVFELPHSVDEGANVHASRVKHESMPLRESTNKAASEKTIPQQVTMVRTTGNDTKSIIP
jgi:hypothetical protein